MTESENSQPARKAQLLEGVTMEYLNHRTYARGDDVIVEITVETERAKSANGDLYESTYVLLHGTSHHFDIKLWGGAPQVTDDKATITLRGKVEGVADDIYRARDGVQGRVPGHTVFYERICSLDRPLKVEGDGGDR